MANTKESNETVQRAELHRKIWAIADNVRGAVDGWDFKQYILGILFLIISLRYFIQKLYHKSNLFSIFFTKKAIHLPLIEVEDFLLSFC